MKPKKPLGVKNFGSIGHLSNSRMGPGDHSVHSGQERICTIKTRDKHDYIWVTEKLDGSNVGVCKVNNEIIALGRAGYPAYSSPYEQHHLFALWVAENWIRFYEVLDEGERIVGEWLAQAHGTRYNLNHEPFVVFDLFINKTERASYEEILERTHTYDFEVPGLVHQGNEAISVEKALEVLEEYGWHGAIDPIEGVVYRVERSGKFDFYAKYVHPWKIDGAYLPEISGKEAVWNWRPKKGTYQ